MLLDDLQWSDEATLELLAALAAPLRELPLLVVAAYRSDELPRAHPLRRLRHDLRRDRALRELTLEPLDAAGTAAPGRAGARRRRRPRGSPPTLHDRTGGIPFFVEELTAALQAGGRLRPGADGLELALDADVPLPQTIRDAVLVRTARALRRGPRGRRGGRGRRARASTSSSWPRSAARRASASCSRAA